MKLYEPNDHPDTAAPAIRLIKPYGEASANSRVLRQRLTSDICRSAEELVNLDVLSTSSEVHGVGANFFPSVRVTSGVGRPKSGPLRNAGDILWAARPLFARRGVAVSKESRSDMPFTSQIQPPSAEQAADIETVLGPPLRQSIIALSGTPVLHRTTWVCGCSTDFCDGKVAASLRWHRCAYHRRIA